jgi:hypothetical protein
MVEVGSKETEMTGNDVPRYELRRAHAVSQVAVISHAEQGMISFAFRVRIQATWRPRQRKPCRDEDTRDMDESRVAHIQVLSWSDLRKGSVGAAHR